MSNHDDFVDEFIEFQIFEDSMKNTCVGNSRKPKKCFSCVTGGVVVILVILVLSFFCSYRKKKKKTNLYGSYKKSFSTS